MKHSETWRAVLFEAKEARIQGLVSMLTYRQINKKRRKMGLTWNELLTFCLFKYLEDDDEK